MQQSAAGSCGNDIGDEGDIDLGGACSDSISSYYASGHDEFMMGPVKRGVGHGDGASGPEESMSSEASKVVAVVEIMVVLTMAVSIMVMVMVDVM
jgi:hypothetical protein